MNFNITNSAWERLAEVLKTDRENQECLRVSILGGGCAGMTYDLSLASDKSDEDLCWVNNSSEVIIDPISAQYLDGATLDFVVEKFNAQFVIRNPNAKTTCGCGTSFVA